MSREQYLIIFTGKRDDDWLVEDEFYRLLKANQSALGITSINHHYSDLTSLAINYIMYKFDMLEHINERFTFKVIKLTTPEEELQINYKIDELFRECVSTFEEPINSTLYYLIERNGKAGFHRISRAIIHDEVVDDDHLNMGGVLTQQPNLFYRHFYNQPYADEQIVLIAKMTLLVGCPLEVVNDF
jgi:hypothetical protein